MNYYNENDHAMAVVLRALIAAGALPEGVVDERSICDVRPTDLVPFAQCHFFAGIGGWGRALALAGWPADRPVWTGSCPCQPFSVAGKRGGTADERHLWPVFCALIGECRPATVFGEQVASPDGREWLAGVSADLEALGYRFGAADLCAAGVGAPHIRQRLYWGGTLAGGMVLANIAGCFTGECASETTGYGSATEPDGVSRGLADDASDAGTEHKHEPRGGSWRPPGEEDAADGGSAHWSGALAIPCRDGKSRRIPAEPALFPLADGLPWRVGARGSVRAALLKGSGNAIVPQCAALFLTAWQEACAQNGGPA